MSSPWHFCDAGYCLLISDLLIAKNFVLAKRLFRPMLVGLLMTTPRSGGAIFFMPKVFDNLYPQITDFANLYAAWQKAVRGKRSCPAAASFEYNLADELICLQQELVEQSWQPGAYHSFYIRDPKQRLVSAAPFRDRVVHHALCNVTEAIYDNTFIGDSYANRNVGINQVHSFGLD